jgi:hypothetical protein
MPIISNLPSLTVGTGTAYVPVVDTTGGTEVTKKASFDVIADYVIGTFGSINQASTTEYGLIKVGTTLQINTVTGVLNVADSPTWVSQRLSSNIPSTSASTGSLVVVGGIGVSGRIFNAGGIIVSDITNSASTTTGAVITQGGLAVARDLTLGGTFRFAETTGTISAGSVIIASSTDSANTTSGALRVQGGLGVGANAYIGGKLYVNGFEVSTSTYLLPTASPSTLGGIKIGAGLLIDGNGVVTANAATNPTPARYLQINSSETENYVSSGEFAGIPGTTNTSGILINRGSIGGDINGANAAGILYSDAFYWNNGFTSTRGTFVLLSALGGSSLTFSGIRVFPGVPEFNIFGSDNTGTVMSVRGHNDYHTLVTDDSHIPNKKYVDSRISTATNIVQGTIKVGDNLSIASAVLSVATATISTPGVVKVGTGLSVAFDGTLSVNQATTTTLGGVIVGNGLTVASGVISVNSIPSDLTVKGQSITVNSTTTSINFVGGGVTVQQSGLDVIVTIGSGGFNGGIVANTTTFVSNVQSVSTNTGAVTIAGGLGVGGNIYARDIYSNGNLIGGGAGTPNGSTTEVQFRYQGTFGADSQFTYNSSTNVLAVDNIQSVAITANSFSSNSGGAPTIASTATLTLEASTASRVVVSQSPIKLASYSNAARNNIIAENGDLIYNTDTNRFQGYANGTWVDLN